MDHLKSPLKIWLICYELSLFKIKSDVMHFPYSYLSNETTYYGKTQIWAENLLQKSSKLKKKVVTDASFQLSRKSRTLTIKPHISHNHWTCLGVSLHTFYRKNLGLFLLYTLYLKRCKNVQWWLEASFQQFAVARWWAPCLMHKLLLICTAIS